MNFEFGTPTQIVFGPGVIGQIGPLTRNWGRCALVVTGRSPRHADGLLAALRGNGVKGFVHSVVDEPDIQCIQTGTTVARRECCDFVIAIGGGSALDAGKAIAAMMTNGGQLLDHLEIIGGGKPLQKHPAPFMAIPTTAGTGSEVTRNSVIASPEHRVKVSLRSPLMAARIALVDPALTLNLPPAITATTGLDALTQLIEPYVCLRANPLTDGLCLEGIERAARSLRIAFDDGRNLNAREDMAVASLFSGIALSNAGLGAVHGLAGPIGGMFPAPHGAICAALLPHVMDANIAALQSRQPTAPALSRYGVLARRMTGNAGATPQDGVNWVRKLVASLQIAPLGTFSIKSANISEIVEKAANASSMKANPIVLTPEELAGVVQCAL